MLNKYFYIYAYFNNQWVVKQTGTFLAQYSSVTGLHGIPLSKSLYY